MVKAEAVTATDHIRKLRGRIAEIGIRHANLSKLIGIHPTLFSAIINGRRAAPKGFTERAHSLLDSVEAASREANELVEDAEA